MNGTFVVMRNSNQLTGLLEVLQFLVGRSRECEKAYPNGAYPKTRAAWSIESLFEADRAGGATNLM